MKVKVLPQVLIAVLGLTVWVETLGKTALSPPARRMEKLGRGLIAIPIGDNRVYVSWRMLGTDPPNIAFNLYRAVGNCSPVKVNKEPITSTTDFIDPAVDLSKPVTYFVRPIVKGREGQMSKGFTLPANPPVRQYTSIPLKPLPDPKENLSVHRVGIGDLDGDGEYDFVVIRPAGGKDPSQVRPSPTTFKVEAYLRDGTFLWRMDLGWNIELGIHYFPLVVYDLDGDGKAEIICKTAEGTIFGDGTIIVDTDGDGRTDYRNERGTVLEGPEFLSVIDGLTGRELARAPWIQRGRISDWGDNYGNRVNRNLLAIAYLDGVRPSIVAFRGYYALTKVEAWDYRNGKLVKRWSWSNENLPKEWWGQGFHNIRIGNVDGDGKDEILHGCMLIDDDGKEVYTTGLGHGDRFYLTDIDPERRGLEVFSCHESPVASRGMGVELRCARTGKILWGPPELTTGDVGRANVGDIDPRYPGIECWAAGGGARWLFSCKGKVISSAPKMPYCNFSIWWDGDLLRELMDIHRGRGIVSIDKWDWENAEVVNLFEAPAQGAYNAPLAYGDIFGDWREEVITYANREIRIYSTTIPAEKRLYTFMHDPIYRIDVALQTMGYMQTPHLSFFVGVGMKRQPRPRIAIGTNEDLVEPILIGRLW
ncbi:MAG: rhamnogalacturonan lyase [Candidatus Fervidibacter sp.]|uniref:rhamnogalacturonan lyase n=1 Tax=Candidatus Fervidibacter sp. TaxID=3100871 RepID=UPI004049F371